MLAVTTTRACRNHDPLRRRDEVVRNLPADQQGVGAVGFAFCTFSGLRSLGTRPRYFQKGDKLVACLKTGEPSQNGLLSWDFPVRPTREWVTSNFQQGTRPNACVQIPRLPPPCAARHAGRHCQNAVGRRSRQRAQRTLAEGRDCLPRGLRHMSAEDEGTSHKEPTKSCVFAFLHFAAQESKGLCGRMCNNMPAHAHTRKRK